MPIEQGGPGPLPLRLHAPRTAEPGTPVGPERLHLGERAGNCAGALERHEPARLAVTHDGPHARVVARDRRQPAGHRLDQDDAERLGRLGGQQQEVGGAQHRRQPAVGHGAQEVDALAHPGPRGGTRNSSRSSPPPATTRWTSSPPGCASASIATSRRLKWWARSSVATNAATSASGGRPRLCRSPPSSPPGENSSTSTPLGISTSFSGPASRALRRYGTERAWSSERHADAVRGADQCGRDRVLVESEERSADAPADEPVLVVDEEGLVAAAPESRPRSVSSDPKMNG